MTENSDFEILKLSWKKGEKPYVASVDPANPDAGIYVTTVGSGDVFTDTHDSVKGFMSREKPQFRFPDATEILIRSSQLRNGKKKVKILRSSLFFYTGQETTLENVREFFTEKAITFLEEDGYIKIIE